MAFTKAHIFNTKQKRTAELAKALAHPARIAILELLVDRASCICGDITHELPLAQSTVSQHLKVLKKSGLIKGQVDGARVCYCLDEETVKEFDERLITFAKKLTTSFEINCETDC